jgi:mannose-6-phosphate isomerase-like protein (cupin superfamily)
MDATRPLDLTALNVCLGPDGTAALVRFTRPPESRPGTTLGVARTAQPPPHAGERHLDGDELLYLVAGRAEIVLERPAGEERVALAAGQAFLVPRGLWHRVLPLGEITLLYATPGPNNERRALVAPA